MSRLQSGMIGAVLATVVLATGALLRAADEPAADAKQPEAKQPAAEAEQAPAEKAEHAAEGDAAPHGDAHAKDGHADAGHADAGHAEAGHADADHGGGHDDHAAGHETGLPMNFKGDLALWSLITFLLFVFVLGKFAWGPLASALDQREAAIRKDIADAEANRMKAETLLREHEAKMSHVQEEVKAILAEARRDAEHVKQDIVSTAQREAEATRQRAVADIERARDVALSELFDFVSKNVVQATEQVLQRSLTGDDHDRLVREALAQMDVRKN